MFKPTVTPFTVRSAITFIIFPSLISSNGIVVQQISTDLTNNSGSYWITIAGETLYSLGNQLTFTNASIQKSIQSLSIIVSLNDSAIKNLTLSINANLSITNSSIKNYMTQVLVNESTIHSEVENYSSDIQVTDNIINSTVDLIRNNLTILQNYTKTYINSTINSIKLQSNFINDTMKNLNLSFNAKVAILNSTLDNLNLNSTTYFNIEHDIINNLNANQTDIYHAAELSGAYSYKLIPENSTLLANGVEIQLWVTTHDGTIVNNPKLVYFLWKNLSAEIISLNNQTSLKPTLISYNAHEMTVLFPLTNQQRNDIISGTNNTVLQLYSPFASGGVSNIATGSINPSNANLGQISGIWATLGFTSNPPYSPNAMKERA